MKFNLTQPCADCPFRSDIQFYLAEGRREEIAADLRHDKTFACHKTVDYDAWRADDAWQADRDSDLDAPYLHNGNESHCAGALIALNRTGEIQSNFLLRLAISLDWLVIEKLNMSAPVPTLDDWINNDID